MLHCSSVVPSPVPAFGRQPQPVFEVGSEPKRAIVEVPTSQRRLSHSLVPHSVGDLLSPHANVAIAVTEKPAARQGVSGISMKRKGKPNTNIAQRGSFNQMQQQVGQRDKCSLHTKAREFLFPTVPAVHDLTCFFLAPEHVRVRT